VTGWTGNGSHMPLEPERRAWLERLVTACERAGENIPDPRDPYLGTLIADIEALRARLIDELHEGKPAP
jgi:hypothetical protein